MRSHESQSIRSNSKDIIESIDYSFIIGKVHAHKMGGTFNRHVDVHSYIMLELRLSDCSMT